MIHHTETTTADGREYLITIEDHWFAGHGLVEGTTRYTVHLINEYRPIIASGTTRAGTDRALDLARQALAGWIETVRPAVTR